MDLPAQRVAQEVIREVGKGRRPSLRKIIPKHGYALSIAKNPKKVTKTKAYQKAIKPITDQLEEERAAIILRLKKTRNKAKYRDLMDGLDKVTKVHQLLTGGKTENLGIEGLSGDVKKLIDTVKNADN